MDKYVNKYKNETGITIYYVVESSCCGGRIEWERGSSSEHCPHCNNKYYKKPNLENKLFSLQDEFLADYEMTGSTRILGEKMFPIIHEYAINLIKALIKGKRSLDYEELSSRAWDAATLLIEVIMKDPEHRMKYSFGKYLGSLCKSVCYSTQRHDRTYSLNSILKDNKTTLEKTIVVKVKDIIDEYSVVDNDEKVSFNNTIEMKSFQENTIIKIVELIEKTAKALFSITNSYSDKLLYIQGLLLKFKYEDDKIISGFYEEVGRTIRNYVEKGEMVVFSELKELASQ